jgi:hypothetical protein
MDLKKLTRIATGPGSLTMTFEDDAGIEHRCTVTADSARTIVEALLRLLPTADAQHELVLDVASIDEAGPGTFLFTDRAGLKLRLLLTDEAALMLAVCAVKLAGPAGRSIH